MKRLCSREPVVPSAESDALKTFAQHLHEARFGPGGGADLAACDAVLKRAEETAARLARGEVRRTPARDQVMGEWVDGIEYKKRMKNDDWR